MNAPTVRPSDWSRHYSCTWPTIVARKQQFDPCGTLAPGQHVSGALACGEDAVSDVD